MELLKNYNYSEKEKKEILKSIVILHDTNEQQNHHIIKYLDEKKIPHEKYNFDFADYSFRIPANTELGIVRDLYFDKHFCIERKAHLEELSGNLGDGRTQFENEFLRAKDCKLVLLIEKGSLEDIILGKYNTEYKPVSYFASILSFQHRYGLDINFVSKEHSGYYIYSLCYYFLREILK